ncbi:DUF7507 domain-containing protein [Agromyces mediolanus]|uniref:DUF7507 domain-containing protein n=1 Tax=Agromyces mediolanus TaxID=41986 RepID=UPI0025596080|nr:hypothetical protein [Agromyces mediolanus]
MTVRRAQGHGRSRVPMLVGAGALTLLFPLAGMPAASAAPAPDATATSITAAGAFTQTVPDGVCAVNVRIAGAAGGVAIADGDAEPDPDNPGGLRGANGAGAVISTQLAVTAGTILEGQVGGNGSNSGPGGLPGGGKGGAGVHPGGGGGGYSELTVGGELLLLAAGGGATGGGHTPDFGHGGDGGSVLGDGIAVTGGTVIPGGDGAAGQDNGVTGDPDTGALPTAPGGGIGGSTVGGAGGTNPRSQTDPDQPGFNWDATAGSSLQGGNGGADNTADTGAGGGGGYFGGGGGASTDGQVGNASIGYFAGGGGGGGSSFVSDSGLLVPDTLDLSKNRDADGEAQRGFVEFDWVMCSYDLAVSKQVVGTPVYEDGATVRYAVTVTNQGADDMAIGDTVSVVDELATGGVLVSVTGLEQSTPEVGETITDAGIEAFDVVNLAAPDDPAVERPRGLAVGESVEIVYDVVVTGTEPVVNTVTVTDRGDASNNAAEATIAPAAPSLALTKTADTERATTVGQKVVYSFKVTNTGNIELRDIAITEGTFSGKGTAPVPSCPTTPVEPGASITCTADYTVVAADLSGAALTNTATADGATPMGRSVVSEQADAAIDTVKPAPAPAASAGLASTGIDGGGYLAVGAGALLLAGLGAFLARRFAKRA